MADEIPTLSQEDYSPGAPPWILPEHYMGTSTKIFYRDSDDSLACEVCEGCPGPYDDQEWLEYLDAFGLPSPSLPIERSEQLSRIAELAYLERGIKHRLPTDSFVEYPADADDNISVSSPEALSFFPGISVKVPTGWLIQRINYQHPYLIGRVEDHLQTTATFTGAYLAEMEFYTMQSRNGYIVFCATHPYDPSKVVYEYTRRALCKTSKHEERKQRLVRILLASVKEAADATRKTGIQHIVGPILEVTADNSIRHNVNGFGIWKLQV